MQNLDAFEADMTSGPGSASRRPLLIAAAVGVVATAAILPFSRDQLGASTTFVTAMLAIVACFEFLSVYLLISDYRSQGDPRLLLMSLAYAWSLVVMCAYALAFPGAVTANPPLALTPSMAPYLYLAWHCGFPVILGLAWAPWPKRWLAPTMEHRRRFVSRLSLALTVATGVAFVAVVLALAHHLPVLIVGLDTHRMTSLTAPLTIPLVLLALVLAAHGTRGRSGPERWSAVAILICGCDLSLTYYSRSRFSLGWYCGRTLTLASAAVVLVALLDSLRRLKARAEHDAAHDQLTGLGNRRSAYISLHQLIARSQRSGAPVGVLSLDLDFFKKINDRHGHAVGDEVLVETGRLLLRSCRAGDVVARVGGEEFLILLADTDRNGTIVVAEKIRAAIAGMELATMPDQVTASIGTTALRKTDLLTIGLLQRADAALYAAKHSGRNRVVESPVALADLDQELVFTKRHALHSAAR
jgi:diguanylate cyclase (GGDEF)-like protein